MSSLRNDLEDAANRMRVSAIQMVANAKSGHTTSSCSAAEIMATLFFHEMRYDVKEPKAPNADRFILSKGHACPILYAAWEEAGLLSQEQLMTLRAIDSDIEGHPTPRLNFIDVATGSLGQGLSCAAGMAYVGKYIDKASYRVYCLLGDGECAEGSVWEAAAFSSHYKLNNLVAIVDVNRLGQSQETALGHNVDVYRSRFAAFGFNALVVDGHNVDELLQAYEIAKRTTEQPTAIIAKTLKGKGLEGIEDADNWHGKPAPVSTIEKVKSRMHGSQKGKLVAPKPANDTPQIDLGIGHIKIAKPDYKIGDKVATRAAYGTALAKLGDASQRVLGFDGDTKNSTFSEKLLKAHPSQFVECFIAEQNMVGVAVGAGCRHRAIPFASTFGAFFMRAADQIRMAAVSFANLKLAGSHVGVSIGEDGPSQMALEDLAFFCTIPNGVVLYPSDAVSAERATELAANTQGIVYIRTSRPALPVIYGNDEHFEIGKAKLVKHSDKDSFLIVGAGVTLYEAVKAAESLEKDGIHAAVIDLFSIQPIDSALLQEQAKRVGNKVITVEDHYLHGGLGDAVSRVLPNAVVHHLAVRELPRSGSPDGLVDKYGISARHIIDAVRGFSA